MTIQKIGLDFFPLNVSLEQDDKFALIEAKHGIIGFAVLIKMYSKIYADKGYYCEWNEDIQLLFSSKIGLERNKVVEIINDAIKWKIFDKDKFDKYKILTSKRIQENYLEITKRRLRVELISEFICIHNTPLNGKNVDIINQNVDIISLNVDILNDSATQRKEVKEVKEVIRDIGIDVSQETSTPEPKIDKSVSKKKIKTYPITFNRTPKIEDAKFIGITQGMIDVWEEAYPAVDFTIEVKKAIAWIYGAGAKGYKSDWYSFLNRWFRKSQDNGGTKNGRI